MGNIKEDNYRVALTNFRVSSHDLMMLSNEYVGK